MQLLIVAEALLSLVGTAPAVLGLLLQEVHLCCLLVGEAGRALFNLDHVSSYIREQVGLSVGLASSPIHFHIKLATIQL